MPARRQICLWEGSRQDGPPSSTPPRPLLTFQGPMQTVRVLQKQTLVASDQDCPVKHWAVCTMLLFMQKSAESHLQCPSGHASANIVSWLAFGGRPVLSVFWLPSLAPHVVATADLQGSVRFWSIAQLLQVRFFHLERSSRFLLSYPFISQSSATLCRNAWPCIEHLKGCTNRQGKGHPQQTKQMNSEPPRVGGARRIQQRRRTCLGATRCWRRRPHR